MTTTAKPTVLSFNPDLRLTAISANTKPPSETASECWKPFKGRTRYLLKSSTQAGWLADHGLISDSSDAFTTDPKLALAFASLDVAASRLAMITHLFPDLEIDSIVLPLFP